MTWHPIELEVATPLFSEGKRDSGADVRISSIRGQLRFWIRALVGAVVGDDPVLVGRVESEIMGAAHTEGSRYGTSKIALRMLKPVYMSDGSAPIAGASHDDARFVKSVKETGPNKKEFFPLAYLAGLGLTELDEKTFKLTRQFVRVGAKCELGVRHNGCSAPAWRVFVAALRLFLYAGGIGSRARKGFGSVRVLASDIDELLPARNSGAFVRDALLNPAQQFGGLASDIAEILERSETDFRGAPEHGSRMPVLGRGVRADLVGPPRTTRFGNKWTQALKEVGRDYRLFRADQDAPTANYFPQRKSQEWLNALNGRSNHAPIAALGLPIVYKPDRILNLRRNGAELRWPSPLHVHLITGATGPTISVLSFVFQVKFPINDGYGRDMSLASRRNFNVVEHSATVTGDLEGMTDAWFATLHGTPTSRPSL